MEGVSNRQKVARILSSHVGHAPDLPLTPQQFVVVNGRHLIEVNCVDGHYATLAQTGEGTYYHLSTGSEGDGAIEGHRRLIIFFANPGGAERDSHASMGFASGHNVDLALPGLQDANR